MKTEHEQGTALNSEHPCILLTFAMSRGVTRVIRELDDVYPGVRDRWMALDRIKIMQDNGFWCNISARPAPIIIIPTRLKHTSAPQVDFNVIAGKIFRTLRRVKGGPYNSAAMCLDHFEQENVNRAQALAFVDDLERHGLHVNLYPY